MPQVISISLNEPEPIFAWSVHLRQRPDSIEYTVTYHANSETIAGSAGTLNGAMAAAVEALVALTHDPTWPDLDKCRRQLRDLVTDRMLYPDLNPEIFQASAHELKARTRPPAPTPAERFAKAVADRLAAGALPAERGLGPLPTAYRRPDS